MSMPGRCFQRSCVSFVLLISAVWVTVPAPPASAQYIYLDANGDGVHTAADVLAPVGTTAFDLWLVTNANRDGGAATCTTGEDLTINSYEFILRATNGIMAWGAFTNLQPDMSTSFGSQSTTAEFYAGFGGGTILPPGTYRLGTLEATPALGTPALAFVAAPATLQGVFATAFGSQCLGQDQDNTLKLGADWFDADGAVYGGTAQAAPVLAPVADMTVSEGAVAEQGLSATDADGQPLQFQKASGPAYMAVETTDPGAGAARGKITLAPGPTAAGAATGVVRVTDGFVNDEATFAITVVAANFPPIIQAPPPVTMGTTSGLNLLARATDPDGEAVTMRERDQASFMWDRDFPLDSEVTMRLRPTPGDVGDWFFFLEATDGIATTNVAVPIHVTGVVPGPPPPDDLFLPSFHGRELTYAAADLAPGDIDGDGIGDLALASDAGGFIEWMRSDGRGRFTAAGRLAARSPVQVHLADLDGNGVLDAVYTDRADGTVNVVLGPLLATAPAVATYPAAPSPSGLAVGDFDGDGSLDAAVVDRTSADLLLFLNDGSGALLAPRSISLPAPAHAFATGDANGDGELDFAVVHGTPHSISLHRNAGDGSFLQPIVRGITNPLPSFPPVPGAIAMGDLNRDGRDDIVTWRRFTGIQVYLTDATGDLLPVVAYAGTGKAAIELADVSGDGVLDLIATGTPDGDGPIVHLIHYRKGAGNGTFLADEGLLHFGFPTGFAVFDFDSDGDRDVIVASDFNRFIEHLPGALALHRNEGEGRFGQEILSEGPSVRGRTILVDVNADGHLDVAGGGGVHLGRGDGTFGPVIGSISTDGAETVITSSDLNLDGHFDLAMASQGATAVTVKLGDGTGNFTTVGPAEFSLPSTITFALGDVNGDEIPDILAGSNFYSASGPGPMQVRLGLGDGSFGPVSEAPLLAAVTSIQLLDLEADGDLDALVSDFYFGPVQLLEGRGDGTFETSRVISSTFDGTGALTLGDLDGNGLVDILTREFQFESSISVIRQVAPGAFTSPRKTWSNGSFANNFPVPMSLADLDLDGRLDLVAGTHGAVVVGMGNGSGGFGRRGFFGQTGAVPLVGDVNEDGWPDIVLNGNEFEVPVPLRALLNQLGRPREARAFPSGSARTIPVGVRGLNLCLRVEPVAGSYENAAVDLTAFTLRSEGTGSVDVIFAIPSKKTALGDEDRNGIEDLGVCFAAGDLGALFSQVQGRRTITATLEGRLMPPARFRAQVTLTVLGTEPSTVPRLTPNPLNPAGVFRFTTTRPGAAHIRLFDVQGRLVRDLLDRPLDAGDHAVPFDGKDRAGRGLASGIYFATVESVDGSWRVRVAILK